MAGGNFGFNALYSRQTVLNNTNYNLKSNNVIPGSITVDRVVDIILGPEHPSFFLLGGWGVVGFIKTSKGDRYIPPLNTNIRNYPLINEIVLIVNNVDLSSLQTPGNVDIPSVSANNNFYISSLNLWNNVQHNAFPFEEIPSSQQINNDYTQSLAGNTQNLSNQLSKINLGNTVEEGYVRPLKYYLGDIIHEGRWGNSIRLGSTVRDKNSDRPYNNWSKGASGTGSPILIIRNGALNIPVKEEGYYTPTDEDINHDGSSIYLSSTQLIPLNASSTTYKSYSGSNYIPPNEPKNYQGNQIVLSSGRLVLNTTNDHILLSSNQSINLNSQKSVNIDTKKFITYAEQIFLGPEYLATEPLLLGNTTVELLRELISTLKELAIVLKSAETSEAYNGPDADPAPLSLPSINLKASLVITSLDNLSNQLEYLTSKNNFTI